MIKLGVAETSPTAVISVVKHENPIAVGHDGGIADHLCIPAVGRHVDTDLVVLARPAETIAAFGVPVLPEVNCR